MRRNGASKRGRVLSILVAAGVGYLFGSWSATAVRSPEPTPAQMVALRFPQDFNQPAARQMPAVARSGPVASGAMDAQLALFSREPMMPQSAAAPPAATQLAEAESAGVPAATAVIPPLAARDHVVVAPPAAAAPVAAVHHVSRPRYFLDDAQIASIRQRLHLSPEQEQMWPAVEAALHNIGVSKELEARRRGGPSSIDPGSSEVQDLKSAAIPLLMSFSGEQKDEVRNLAHVMGLDQLASQF
jgi:hypothetical protein